MRLFIDMDGVLAKWGNVDYEERLYEKGYFKDLDPVENVVNAVNRLINEGYDVYILSKYLEDSRYALKEKKMWSQMYLPNLHDEKKIWVRYNENKSDCIPDGIGRNDFLLDDYSPNLFEFQASGGQGIKLLNGINHTKGTWNGAKVNYRDSRLSESIIDVIKMNMIHVEERLIGEKRYAEYDISYLNNDETYKGYFQLGDREFNKESIQNEILGNKNMDMINLKNKEDIMTLSSTMRRIITDIPYSIKGSQKYTISDNEMNEIMKKELNQFSMISLQSIEECMRRDISRLRDEGLISISTNNDICIDPEIILKYDLSNMELQMEKSHKFQSMYYFTSDQDMKEIACEYAMPNEYHMEKQKELEKYKEM